MINPEITVSPEVYSSKKPGSVFSGQGSQVVGMGFELYEFSPEAKNIIDQADDILERYQSRLMFNGSQDELNRTENAQPAICTVGVASFVATWEEFEGKLPLTSSIAGHSVGQITGLIAGKIMSFETGLTLVKERGRLMQQAAEKRPGGMAALLNLDMDTLDGICAETGVEIANINSDTQVVISGDKIAVGRAMDLASSSRIRGAKAIPLPVTGAFHSTLMIEAQEEFAEVLDKMEFKDPDPETLIVGNSSARPLRTGQEIKEELLKGVCSCVRWSESMQFMMRNGITHFLEFGPGSVLAALIKRIDKERVVQAFSIGKPDDIQDLKVAMAA